ncbi:MAG TPA: glycosyltransferase family 4 protein [Planococcus sp. (in: firmicutes)]|nr:glycosyltransferase family 4 protein [Planococcus sp. (in: firmicutes)]
MAAKVIHAVTISESLVFLEGQLKYLNSRGYDAKALSSNGGFAEEFADKEGTQVLLLDMEREISLAKDFGALIKCIRILRQEKPDIVNASTPKAGLIVTLAALICGVPIRIYNMRGLRLETTGGLKRRILLAAEKVSAGAATHCLAVSNSLRDQVIDFKIADSRKISVLGKGSGDGFDVGRFQLDSEKEREMKELKTAYGFGPDDLVLGFAGRLTNDKGITELVNVFEHLARKYENLKLLIVGNYESTDPVAEETKSKIEGHPDITFTGFQKDPVPFFHMMDVFVFLTKREGFGNVSIEAALSGIPVVVSNVTGAKDTIVDGRNGFLVDGENQEDIAEKLELLILAPELRAQMGEFGQRWAADNFSNATIWNELDGFYQQCMAERLRTARQVL